MDKFADLIIKECCKLISDYGDHVAIAEDNWDDKSHYLCMRIKDPIYKIEEHFGMVKPYKIGEYDGK